VPVAEEAVVVQRLLERGWAVSAGERFRHRSPAGIRITTSDLGLAEAEQLATALDEVTRVVLATYAG
jgi:hypothetical protein